MGRRVGLISERGWMGRHDLRIALGVHLILFPLISDRRMAKEDEYRACAEGFGTVRWMWKDIGKFLFARVTAGRDMIPAPSMTIIRSVSPALLLLAVLCRAQSVQPEELRRRVQFANAHFSTASNPGFETDRGRVYVACGAPDRVRSVPESPNGGDSFPLERRTYRRIPGVGNNVRIYFVDAGLEREYTMTPVAAGSETPAEAAKRVDLIRARIRRVLGGKDEPAP